MTRTRDAERSREAILDAAERVFSERGFDGASLSEIGAAAGLSRAAPTYFYGSKEVLYREVLERVFAARQQATEAALAPVHAWCARGGDLRAALTGAVSGYTEFLLARPSFARLVTWEELAGAGRLHGTARDSDALQRAFDALAAAAPHPFDPGDAVLVFVSLAYTPVAQRATLMTALGRDVGRARDTSTWWWTA